MQDLKDAGNYDDDTIDQKLCTHVYTQTYVYIYTSMYMCIAWFMLCRTCMHNNFFENYNSKE